MLVSKKEYDFLSDRYKQSTSHTNLLKRQLADLNSASKKNDSPYKCVLEYRETATALSSSGHELTWQALERLAFADRWMSGLPPALTRQISIQE